MSSQLVAMHYEFYGQALGRMRSMFTIFSNGSIIPPGFQLMELHALTLASRSYALLAPYNSHTPHNALHYPSIYKLQC